MSAVSQPANEAKRLAALRRYKLLDTAPEQAFDDFAEIASVLCQTPIASVSLIDAERQWLKAKIGLENLETPREHAFCAHTILTDVPLVVEDALADERFATNPLVTASPFIRFYAGAPLIDGEGNALGALCVIDHQPRRFAEPERKALAALARQVMARIELRRTAEELAEALAEVKDLQRLLPICAHCKSIRNDEGYWNSVEEYLSLHGNARFSHSFCPICFERHYPEVIAARGKREAAP